MLKEHIQSLTAELRAKPVPLYRKKGIIEKATDHFRFRREISALKRIRKSIEKFNLGNDCGLFESGDYLYMGCLTRGSDELFVVMELEPSEEIAELKVMLPLTGNADQIDRLVSQGIRFWGSHPTVYVNFSFNELISGFGGFAEKALDLADDAYRKCDTELETDKHYLFFVDYRMYHVSLFPAESRIKLAEMLLEKIRAEKKAFHMPAEDQEAHTALGKDEFLNIDLLISKLFGDRLATTITDFAWLFEKNKDEARQLAQLALEAGDSEAEKVILSIKEEDVFDDFYMGEVRNTWKMRRR